MTKITQPPESTNNPLENKHIDDIEAGEETVYQPQNELPFPTEVDLNEVFQKRIKTSTGSSQMKKQNYF